MNQFSKKEWTSDFFGNERLKDKLIQSIMSHTFFHSVILTGPAGTGKKRLAYQIAAALSCQNEGNDSYPLPCGECESCRKILKEISTDVILLQRVEDKATISVEQSRSVVDSTYISENELDRKVYIVEDFDKMTEQGQNALLKTLEEPPRNVYFLLLCESIQNILSTVLSRSILYRISPLGPDLLEKILREDPETASEVNQLNNEQLETLIRYSHGSLGVAKELLSRKPDKLETALESYLLPQRILHILASASERPSYPDLLKNLTTDSAKRSELLSFFQSFALASRDLIAVRQNNRTDLLYFLSREEAESISSAIPVKRSERLYRLSEECRDLTDRNVLPLVIKSRFSVGIGRIFNL